MNGTAKVVLVVLIVSLMCTVIAPASTDFDTLKKIPLGGSYCVTRVVLEHNMTDIGPGDDVGDWAPSI